MYITMYLAIFFRLVKIVRSTDRQSPKQGRQQKVDAARTDIGRNSRGPQSRERHKRCSRTNSNLMDNFSQNQVYSVQVLHGICPKKYLYLKKKFFVTGTECLRQSPDCPWQTQSVHDGQRLSITDTDYPWQTQTVHDRHRLSMTDTDTDTVLMSC